MAESHLRAARSERAGDPRPARALTRVALLTGAILTVLLGGLFVARPAVAAPAVAKTSASAVARGSLNAVAGRAAAGATIAHAATDSLAAAVVSTLQRAVASGRGGRWLMAVITAAARGLPVTGPGDHATALTRLAAAGSCPPAWSVPLRSAASTVALRRSFWEEIR